MKTLALTLTLTLTFIILFFVGNAYASGPRNLCANSQSIAAFSKVYDTYTNKTTVKLSVPEKYTDKYFFEAAYLMYSDKKEELLRVSIEFTKESERLESIFSRKADDSGRVRVFVMYSDSSQEITANGTYCKFELKFSQ